jgi:membrane fusion protein
MSDLFRKEAVSHATRRLSGTVVLATPLSVRLLGFFFVGIVVAAVFFASMATYARKATVTGWLVPDLGLIRATAVAAGSVQAVSAKEGEVVESGARLAEIRIGSETAAGNVGEMVAQQLRAEATATRERARSRIGRLNAETEQSLARLTKLRIELQQIQQQATLQEQRLGLARQEVARSEDIAARGLLTRRDLEARRQAALSSEQELAGQRRQLASIEREIADINARMSAIVIEKETTDAESRSAEASLEQRIIDAEARRVQLVLAPVGGRVAALPVAVGQPVAVGTTVAVIIPQGGRLEAELLAPTRAVGFVRPGQEVSLMLQAFPHQRFGTVKGTVRTMSNTVLGPTEIAIPGLSIQEPVFRVRVTLPRDVIHAYGETVPLQPGMLLSADIVFDRRSLIQWLFDPLFAVTRRS